MSIKELLSEFKDVVNEDIMTLLEELYEKNKIIIDDESSYMISLKDALEVRKERGWLYEGLLNLFNKDNKNDIEKEDLKDILMIKEDGFGGSYGYCDKYGFIDFDHESYIKVEKDRRYTKMRITDLFLNDEDEDEEE